MGRPLAEDAVGRFAPVRGLLEQAVAEGVTAGVELVVRQDGVERFHAAAGWRRLVPVRLPLARGGCWDLASLTKPLAGAAVAFRLVDAGVLAFDRPVADLLPGVDPRVRLAELLAHCAGYPAWLPFYERVDRAGLAWGSPAARALVLDEAIAAPLEAAPGLRCVYSDVGFIVLCALLERAGGDRIDRLWRRLVARPAGMRGFSWATAPRAAATEACPRRGGVVEGAVHDLNCAAMGGISTHAGLFGTARGVAEAGEAFLDAHRGRGPLAGDAIRVAWSWRGPGSHRLGWDGRSPEGSSSGRRFPPDAVGHLGFTGTSLWIAPRQRVVVALLSNRVHPSAAGGRIRELRPRVHDAVVDALDAAGLWR